MELDTTGTLKHIKAFKYKEELNMATFFGDNVKVIGNFNDVLYNIEKPDITCGSIFQVIDVSRDNAHKYVYSGYSKIESEVAYHKEMELMLKPKKNFTVHYTNINRHEADVIVAAATGSAARREARILLGNFIKIISVKEVK